MRLLCPILARLFRLVNADSWNFCRLEQIFFKSCLSVSLFFPVPFYSSSSKSHSAAQTVTPPAICDLFKRIYRLLHIFLLVKLLQLVNRIFRLWLDPCILQVHPQAIIHHEPVRLKRRSFSGLTPRLRLCFWVPPCRCPEFLRVLPKTCTNSLTFRKNQIYYY